VYSSFLTNQVNSAQTQVSSLDTYYNQISQIDNMIASTTTGVSFRLGDVFFQESRTSLPIRRRSLLGSRWFLRHKALVSRFQSLDDQLDQMYEDKRAGHVSGVVRQLVCKSDRYFEPADHQPRNRRTTSRPTTCVINAINWLLI